jgi:hypothetical protein
LTKSEANSKIPAKKGKLNGPERSEGENFYEKWNLKPKISSFSPMFCCFGGKICNLKSKSDLKSPKSSLDMEIPSKSPLLQKKLENPQF